VSVLPPVGTVPEKDTVPLAGATTATPDGAPMSMPRCRPAAYGSGPKLNARSTGPCTGHAQAFALPGAARAVTAEHTARQPAIDGIRCQFCKPRPRYQAAAFVVKSDYSVRR
jgi:hypothetical protein